MYSKYDAAGKELTNADLDDCHGYDPGDGSGYRYIANDEYPYLTHCYKGTPSEKVQAHCDGKVKPSRRL